MLGENYLWIRLKRDVASCLCYHVEKILVSYIENTILYTVFDRVECPDVVARNADFFGLISWVESDPIDKLSFPLRTCNDSSRVPVKHYNFRVDLICQCNANHVVVSYAWETEIDNNLWFAAYVPTLRTTFIHCLRRIDRWHRRSSGLSSGVWHGWRRTSPWSICLVLVIVIHTLSIDEKISSSLAQLSYVVLLHCY